MLFKASVLCYLGLFEEAGVEIQNLISTYTEPSGPVQERSSLTGDMVPNKKLDPAQFRAHFYQIHDASPLTGDGAPSISIAPAQRCTYLNDGYI